MALGKKMIFLF